MKFHPGKAYKVVEFDSGLVIINSDDNIVRAGAHPLAIADASTLIEYLFRYFFEREQGKTLEQAHHAALKGAHIININHRNDK